MGIFPLTGLKIKSIFFMIVFPQLGKSIQLTLSLLGSKMRRWGYQKMVPWNLYGRRNLS